MQNKFKRWFFKPTSQVRFWVTGLIEIIEGLIIVLSLGYSRHCYKTFLVQRWCGYILRTQKEIRSI